MTWKAPIIGVAVLLVILGGAAWWFLHLGRGGEDLSTYRQQLRVEDPRLRLSAAERILRNDPSDGEALLVKGQILVESMRFAEARELLKPLTGSASPHHVKAVELCAESYIAEARRLVAVGSSAAADMNGPRVSALMDEADAFRRLLSGDGDAAAARAAALIEARQRDVQAAWTKQALKGLRVELAKAQAAQAPNQEELAGRIANLTREAERMDEQVEQLCGRALEGDGHTVDPHVLLFDAWLRDGKYDRARQAAERIAGHAQLDRAVAGAVADALLNVEEQYAQPVTATDIALARRLLAHPALVGTGTTAFALATGALALADGKPGEAEKQARNVLADYDSHPQALRLLAAALVQEGKAGEAVRLLQPINERVPQAPLRCALGLAQLARGDAAQGRELLRQAVNMAPDYLPARLGLAESLVRADASVDAEPDILAAVRLSPDHPRVRNLRARLLVEKRDNTALVDLLTKDSPTAPLRPWAARDVVLAAAMVMDDTATVKRQLDLAEPTQPEDGLSLIAFGWLQTAPLRRATVADQVLYVALDELGRDPLSLPNSPSPPSLSRSVLGPRGRDPAAVSAEPLHVTHFLPWPEEAALQLVEWALDRWPGHPDLVVQAAELNLLLGRLPEARQWAVSLNGDDPAAARCAIAIQTYCDGQAATLPPPTATAPAAAPRGLPWEYLELAQALRRRDTDRVSALLAQYLRNHPWAEQAVLLVLRDAFARQDRGAGETALERVQPINPALAALERGRWNLAWGNAQAALTEAGIYERAAPPDRSRRLQGAELSARANLALPNPDAAEAVFGDQMLYWAERRADLQLGWADVLLESDRPVGAAKALTNTLADTPLSPRQMDQVLARCASLMSGPALREAVAGMLKATPGDPLLLLYQARALEKEGEPAAAEAVVDRVLAVRPAAPRVLMAKARLAALQDRTGEALRVYSALAGRGGRAGAAARVELDRLNQALPPPTTAPSGAQP